MTKLTDGLSVCGEATEGEGVPTDWGMRPSKQVLWPSDEQHEAWPLVAWMFKNGLTGAVKPGAAAVVGSETGDRSPGVAGL